MEPGGKWTFNPIDHEVTRSTPGGGPGAVPGGGAGHTENIVKLIGGLIDAAGFRGGQRSGRDNEAYWKQACEQLLRNAVDLLVAAKGRVSIPDLYRVVTSAPLSVEDVSSGVWAKAHGLCYRSLMEGHARAKSPSQAEDFEVVGRYWVEEFPALSDRTRSSITSMFTASMDAFNRGVLKHLFCRESTITPEAIEEGKIILVHLPVKSHGQVGLYANVVMKQAFQRSIERRPPAPRNNNRPVFLWADEGHFFLHPEDSLFQSTCRSSGVVSVLITQNIPNIDAAMGSGDAGRAHAESLLANFGTLVFHGNTCQRTNDFAAGLIGRAPRFMVNGSTSQDNGEWTASMLGLGGGSGGGGGGQSSSGFSEVMEHIVPPATFPRLACPSPGNGWRSEAIVVQSGSVFPRSGRTWKRVVFSPDGAQGR